MEEVEDILDELVRRGLVKESWKDGKQYWYVPEDKQEDVKKFIKELEELEKGEKIL